MRLHDVVQDGRGVLMALWYLRHADEVGARVRLRGRPIVSNRGRMVIGHRVQLVSTAATLELATMKGGTLEIGARTLVMVADPDYHAIRVYRAVGFDGTESQLQAQRAPAGDRVIA